MAAAEVWSRRGTCQRRQVGAVVSFEGRILATGYNGAPKGLAHCDHRCTGTCFEYQPEEGLFAPKVWKYDDFCDLHGSRLTCTNAVHAEANAIAFAARYGLPLDGATMHVWGGSPCLPCAQIIINAGTVRVSCSEQYHDLGGMRLLVQAGLQVS